MYFRTTDRHSATDKDAAGADLWKVVEGVVLVGTPLPRLRVEGAVAVAVVITSDNDAASADAVGNKERDAARTEAAVLLLPLLVFVLLMPEDSEPWPDLAALDEVSEGGR